MADTEKPSLADYKQSLLSAASDDRLFANELYYNSYMNGLTSQVKDAHFSTIVRELSLCKEEYIRPDFLFLTEPSEVTLKYKPLSSVFDKIFRKNVVWAKKWPPKDGAETVSLCNFTEFLDDIFRTRFICRYLDGPEYVCQKLNALCEKSGVACSYKSVTTALGYHAWHFYYKQPIDDFGGRGAKTVSVELQFTTQLAEVISSLTHVQYENSRIGGDSEPGWRWNVKSKQFRPYYIAHGLHLLEGVILEFRDSILNETNKQIDKPANKTTQDGGPNND